MCNDLHIGNIKIGPIKRKDGKSDLVTVVGDNSYWGKEVEVTHNAYFRY